MRELSRDDALPNNQKNTSTQPIPVFFPDKANISLHNGESLSGSLKNLDAQEKKITFTLSGEFKTVSNADIDKIEFEGEFNPCEDDKNSSCKTIIIRGSNNANSDNQITLKELLTSFKILDADKGKAQIEPKLSNPSVLKGMRAVLQTNDYVIEEIKFEPSDMIEIIAKPYERKK